MSQKVVQLKEKIIVKDRCHKSYLNEPFKHTFEFKNSTPESTKKVMAVVDTKSKTGEKI